MLFPRTRVSRLRGCCVSTSRNFSSERRENLRRELYCCSTAAAKKNDGDRLAISKLAETLRIGSLSDVLNGLFTKNPVAVVSAPTPCAWRRLSPSPPDHAFEPSSWG